MRRIMLLLVSLAVGLILGSGVAWAVSTVVTGGTINQVQVVRETDVSTTTSTSFVDIPGASVSKLVEIPAGTTGVIMVRFSAESACVGIAVIPGSNDAWCSIRIMAQDAAGAMTEMRPASGSNFAFDSSGVQNDREAHSMDRSAFLSEGSYRIRPQWAVVNGAAFFSIDDYSLIIERTT